MSVKDLFEKNISSVESAASGSSKTESYDFVLAKKEKNDKFVPRIDYSSASSFSFYGSAKLYYEKTIERIHNNFPYDGSKKEKTHFHLSSSQFEEWLYNNLYPKTNGYISFSYGGWGTQTSTADGYGLPASTEYIYSRGGLHTASAGMEGKALYKTFDKSVKYDSTKNRTINYRMNVPEGLTVEFWLKKDSFDISKTEKEVILDLWNGNAASASNYGRFTLALTSSGESDGSNTFLVTLQSGSVGFFEQTIGNSSITTSSLGDWHHYALSFVSASNGIESRIYLDGNLNQKSTLGTQGVNEVGGLINAYIGALQTSPSGSSAAQYAGKLSASLDEFRYWKSRRTSEQIANSWNTVLGSGTNTDEANTNLGVYYKFNEGIVGESKFDSIVLDYSGRIANGTWNGYSSGARSTDSAIVLASAAATEQKDPIVYSTHPDVVTLKTNLANSGSARDASNGNLLINRFPKWLVDEDEEVNNNFKFLTQIISTFLDELYLEISELRKLKFSDYYPTTFKPLPFASRLVSERGIDTKDILKIATTLEKYENRNVDATIFENDINDIKNIIYQNIYNNLPKILKSKGTERSFRNMLRCFGIDDEIIKLNIYTNKGTHSLTDKYKVTSYNKKTIDFGNSNAFSSIVFQTSSANNVRTYIYGSDSTKNERFNALTFEINALMPFKTPSNEDAYVYYGELTSSIGGFHEAVSDPTDYTFATNNLASLQIYAIRDEIDSKKAKFMLKSHDGTLQLTSSLYLDVYENSLWTLAARVKPVGYPFYGSYSSGDQDYIVDFYGVRHKAGEIDDHFHLTSSISYASGSSIMSNRKRVFVGANKTNFTGSILQKSDVKISNCRFYLDYLDNSVLNEHNKDVTIQGSNKSFEGNTAFNRNLSDKKISSMETIALSWDFNMVTGSDSSGQFIVQDITSGSSDTIYGWIDEIIRREHRGLGYGFENSDTNLLSREFLTLYKKELPEISYSADNITIAGIEEEAFLADDDVSDSLYALEKSMYQVISEKMLETISSTSEMNNLFGKAIERYRFNYKKLDYAKRIFFEKVEEDPDFDKFTEYFRWIDNSIFSFVKNLIPASVSFVDNISDVVESHIFERNKVRTLLPNRFVDPTPEDHINSIRELTYNWKFGHAPGTKIPDIIGKINFDLDAVSQINHAATLQVTGGATTFLAEINDPSVAVAHPNADLLMRTGSTGLAFRASGSNRAMARSGSYSGVSNNDFSVSFWLHSGDASNAAYIQFMESGLGRHIINFDGDIRIYYENNAGSTDYARFNTDIHNDVGEWNHYATHFDVSDLSSGVPKLWKNGVEITGTGYTAVGGTTPTIDELRIQMDDAIGFQDIVFWDKLLTQADINTLYNSGSWFNPSTHVSSSKIIDWYKYGYEGYWSGLGYSSGSVLSDSGSVPYTISSSFGTGNNDLKIVDTTNADEFLFIDGLNPYGADKSNSIFWGELSSSLSSSFEDFTISFAGSGPANFTMLSNSLGSETLAASETGNDFSNIVVTQGASSYVKLTDNDNCLWQKERRERTDITARETIRKIIENDNNQKASTLVDNSGNTYQGSTYAIRRLSRVYKESVSMVRSLHGGINYEIQKNRRISKNVLEPHSKLNSSGIPINVILVGAGTGQGIELKTECNDVIDPNLKEKFNVQTFLGKFAAGTPGGVFAPIDDTQSFSFGLKGALSLPFNIISASVNSGYNKAFHDGFKPGTLITNLHSDTATDKNDIPLQSPFTERWVGGHQSRHQEINRHDPTLIDGETLSAPPNNLHNIYTRPESHRLLLIESGGSSDGAIGLVDAQYGVTAITGHPNTGSYPDVAKKKAAYFREETAKRPVNIKNIQTTTASFSHGNYREQYEILSVASGKQHNNPLFRSNADTHQYLPSAIETTLPKTTNYKTLFGIGGQENGNVFGQGASNLLDTAIDTSKTTGPTQKSVISTRFSAPGGIETMTYGFLDAHNQEMSAYNSLAYRNLLVRGSGSGENGTIRVNDHLGNREGLITHLSRHSGKFGSDSVHGSVVGSTYVTKPSYHKIPRNVARKPVSTSTQENPSFNLDHDNFFVRSTLPRSDYQYTWITSSLGDNYSITSGKQRMFGYAPRDGILSSSYEVDGDSGYVGAITFPTASELFGE